MAGEGVYADQMKMLFLAAKRKAGFKGSTPELSSAAFKVPTDQLELFEG